MSKIRSTEENVGVAYSDRTENLLEWLYQLRDRQRQHQRQGAWLIKGRDLPWENNRQGKMKWFLHPALSNTSIRSMIVFEQEIPPGGRSGAQKTPGGSVLYILEGKGYTLLDGERHVASGRSGQHPDTRAGRRGPACEYRPAPARAVRLGRSQPGRYSRRRPWRGARAGRSGADLGSEQEVTGLGPSSRANARDLKDFSLRSK